MGNKELGTFLEQGFHHEIERKFVVATLPENLSNFPHFKIVQSYLGDGTRIRKINEDQYLFGKKIGVGIDRLEKEVPITKEEYEQKLSQAIGGTIIKERYVIEHEKGKIDLDVYRDNLDGLIIAEIEFDTVGQSKLYIPLSWFRGEVTGNKDYSNESLARWQMLPFDLNRKKGLLRSW